MKIIIIITYLLIYFLDLIFYNIYNFSSSDSSWNYIILIFIMIYALPIYYFSFLFYLVKEIKYLEKILINIALISLLIFLDLIKILGYNYHPFLSIHSIIEFPTRSELQEKKRLKEWEKVLKRREEYQSIYSSNYYYENKLFFDDKLQSNFIYEGKINEFKIQLGKTKYFELNKFIDINNSNVLSFVKIYNYSTEERETVYNKIIEFRTNRGRISFLVLNDEIRDCIFDELFGKNEFEFIKICQQKSEFYNGFWRSTLHKYCPQRSMNFRYSNECDYKSF